MLDGIAKLELRRTWDESPFLFANGPTRTLTLGLTATLPYDRRWIDSTRWDDERVIDARAQYVWHAREPSGWSARGMLLGGTRIASGTAHLFERVEGELVHAAPFGKRGRFSRTLRAFVGLSDDAPAQRSLGASSLDATETFSNHWLRGIDAPLARPDVHYLSPGGAEMRGYSPLLRARNIAALNAQLAATVHQPRAGSWTPRLQLTAFADGAWGSLFGISARTLADAGVGLIATGMLWDRSYALRVDAPFFVSRPELGIGDDASSRRFRARWAFSLGESF
jgi:hypothetical protein